MDVIWKYKYVLLYSVTVIVGIIYRKKFWHEPLLKYWFIFVIYSFLNEVSGRYMLDIMKVNRVIFPNNLWFLVNSLFYLFFFRSLVKSKRRKAYNSLFIAVFLLFLSVQVLFFKGLNTDYFIDTFILGQFFVVLSILIFFTETLSSNRIFLMRKSLFFYIAFGALIFNVGLLPVYVIAEYIGYRGVFRVIIITVNVVLNASFVFGFIRSQKEFNRKTLLN